MRFGGHRQAYETGWQCAQREVYEEANIQIKPLSTRTTYLADKAQPEAELTKIRWGGPTYQDHTPVLVVADGRTEPASLSLMYLAQADEMPTPSSEIKGLLLLDEAAIHRLCQEPITLGEYLRSGGKAVLRGNFNTRLPLEPFVQLRLSSRILLAQADAPVA
ncbi:MAG TPA: NUDIX domain-containing protein [Anaerolineales bacterium]|nr:NUDIX domain-containing protein [Anaerolineales bacterium]